MSFIKINLLILGIYWVPIYKDPKSNMYIYIYKNLHSQCYPSNANSTLLASRPESMWMSIECVEGALGSTCLNLSAFGSIASKIEWRWVTSARNYSLFAECWQVWSIALAQTPMPCIRIHAWINLWSFSLRSLVPVCISKIQSFS